MATSYTPNYHLGKQEDKTDTFSMDIITENMDILDSTLKNHADAISDLTSTTEALTTETGSISDNMDILNTLCGDLSTTSTEHTSDISSLNVALNNLTNTVNSWAVSKYAGDAVYIGVYDSIATNLRHGVLTGNFSEQNWRFYPEGSGHTYSNALGVLVAYTLWPSGLGDYVQQFLYLPGVHNGLLLERHGYAPVAQDFNYVWSQERHYDPVIGTITSSWLEDIRRGTVTGMLATDITGGTDPVMGIVRIYSFNERICWDLYYGGHNCIQIAEAADGTRRTRYWDKDALGLDEGAWSAWV